MFLAAAVSMHGAFDRRVAYTSSEPTKVEPQLLEGCGTVPGLFPNVRTVDNRQVQHDVAVNLNPLC